MNFVQLKSLFFILCLLCACQQYKFVAISAYNPGHMFFRCSNTGIDKKKYRFLILFCRLSNDTAIKIILLLLKLLSPSENDDHKSTLKDKYGTGH